MYPHHINVRNTVSKARFLMRCFMVSIFSTIPYLSLFHLLLVIPPRYVILFNFPTTESSTQSFPHLFSYFSHPGINFKSDSLYFINQGVSFRLQIFSFMWYQTQVTKILQVILPFSTGIYLVCDQQPLSTFINVLFQE